ncbi:MAG: glycosyltransferase family 39 protein [Rhizobiales bacterium]|nr:glycosyltransferase family 39 protein [Hyphomicrobiales bacterium]
MRFIQPDLPLVWLTRSRLSPYAWILILWALLVVPGVFLVGAHYDEGTTIGLARGAFQDGHWLAPHLYGYRVAERPALVSWLLGVVGLVFGDFDLWVGRLPAVGALLGGAMLVYWFARRAVGRQGATFAAACLLLSPMVIQKLITAENDGVVSIVLFAAFVVWWIGNAAGGPTLVRWAVIGLVLAVAGLVEGPQPLGLFFLGVGLYLVVRRKWRELAGLALAALIAAVFVGGWYWAVYQPDDAGLGKAAAGGPTAGEYLANILHFAGQLCLELMPALILVVPLAIDVLRRRIEANRELVLALLAYAVSGTVVLLFWPSAVTRQAMPIVPAVAVLGGIGYHHFLARLPRLVLGAQIVAGGLLVYVLVLNWVVMPLFPAAFSLNADTAQPIVAAIVERPAPVYVVGTAVNRDVLFYLPKPRLVSVDQLAQAKPPFWAIVTRDDERDLQVARPDLAIGLRLEIPKAKARLVEVTKP